MPSVSGSLVVEYAGDVFVTLAPGRVYQIGRDPAADVTVDVPGVSWRHAELLVIDGQWLIRDLGSTNGTFCAGQLVRRIKVAGNVQFRLGDPETGPLLSCRVAGSMPARAAVGPVPGYPATAEWRVHPAANRVPTGVHRMLGRPMLIGRASGNDVVIADLLVSSRHAELRALGDGRFLLTDAGSHSGTFINGRRITSMVVTEEDVSGIGTERFRVGGHEK